MRFLVIVISTYTINNTKLSLVKSKQVFGSLKRQCPVFLEGSRRTYQSILSHPRDIAQRTAIENWGIVSAPFEIIDTGKELLERVRVQDLLYDLRFRFLFYCRF